MQKAKRRRRSSRKELVSWALASALLCLLVAGYDAHEMAGRRASTTSARETLQSQRRKQTMRPATDADSFNASGDMAFARRQIKIAPTAAAAAATKNNEGEYEFIALKRHVCARCAHNSELFVQDAHGAD